jgi:hypothetical protein
VKFYTTVASISEGSPSFILLATCILEQSDTSLSRTIHRHCCRTRTRTLHTQSLSPRSGIGPRHQLYVDLSGLTYKGRKRDKEALGFPMQQHQSIIKISPTSSQPQSSQLSLEPLVTQGPVSTTYSCLGLMRELPLLVPQWLQSDQRGRWSLSPLTDCNHGSPYTHL